MDIYTVIKDECFDFEHKQEGLMSFYTKDEAKNFIIEQSYTITQDWKNKDGFELFDRMDAISTSDSYQLYVYGRYEQYHTTLTIVSSRLVGG